MDEPAPSLQCFAPAARDPQELLIAGSGAALAPTRMLVEAYRRAHPRARVRVAPSIGTGGALRALHDGAIDVGLAARGLSAAERRGLRVTPLATIPLVLALHRRHPLPKGFDQAAAVTLLDAAARFGDGTAVVPLYRQRGDAVDKALAIHAPALARAMERARAEHRGLTRYTDQSLLASLRRIPGALGVIDAGTLRLSAAPLRSMELRPRGPGEPPRLDLALLTRAPPSEQVATFLRFARSPAARRLLAERGYTSPGAQP